MNLNHIFKKSFSKFKIYTKGSKGFSLVELLVSIAIIGIISSIATIKLGVYYRQGKTTEAKVMLSNIYGNERTYFIEFQSYHYDLTKLGLDFNGKYLYNAGFATTAFEGICPAATSWVCQPNSPASNIFKICGISFDAAGKKEDCFLEEGGDNDTAIQALNGKCVEDLDQTNILTTGPSWGKLKIDGGSFKTYSAIACSDLGGDKLDVWSIDWRKDLIHRKDGTE